MEVRPDIAGFEDLAHAFDLKGSVLAARATLDCALARRETRGAHNRSDYPERDPGLAVNLIWRPGEPVGREAVGEPSPEVAALVKRHDEIPVGGRLLE
jgi:succinate dehydrogenase flavoprotein subunit